MSGSNSISNLTKHTPENHHQHTVDQRHANTVIGNATNTSGMVVPSSVKQHKHQSSASRNQGASASQSAAALMAKHLNAVSSGYSQQRNVRDEDLSSINEMLTRYSK